MWNTGDKGVGPICVGLRATRGRTRWNEQAAEKWHHKPNYEEGCVSTCERRGTPREHRGTRERGPPRAQHCRGPSGKWLEALGLPLSPEFPQPIFRGQLTPPPREHLQRTRHLRDTRARVHRQQQVGWGLRPVGRACELSPVEAPAARAVPWGLWESEAGACGLPRSPAALALALGQQTSAFSRLRSGSNCIHSTQRSQRRGCGDLRAGWPQAPAGNPWGDTRPSRLHPKAELSPLCGWWGFRASAQACGMGMGKPPNQALQPWPHDGRAAVSVGRAEPACRGHEAPTCQQRTGRGEGSPAPQPPACQVGRERPPRGPWALQPPGDGSNRDAKSQKGQGSPVVRTGRDTPSKDSGPSQGASSHPGFVLGAQGSGLAGG